MMESIEYKKQYGEYLARAEEALNRACERYLPEESEVCRAARYSLMGGGKRIRAVLVPCAICSTAAPRRQSSLQRPLRCCTAIRSSTTTCPAWTMTICAGASPPATRHSESLLLCWRATCC